MTPHAYSHIAWSKQNIVARAGPPTAATLTISLSRLPSKGRQEKPIRLALPRKRPGESTHRLAFSPAGSHLIVVTSLPQTTDASLLTVSNAGLRFAIFEQGLTACWQEWEIAHEWVVGTLAGESPAVVDLQWPAAEPEVRCCTQQQLNSS